MCSPVIIPSHSIFGDWNANIPFSLKSPLGFLKILNGVNGCFYEATISKFELGNHARVPPAPPHGLVLMVQDKESFPGKISVGGLY